MTTSPCEHKRFTFRVEPGPYGGYLCFVKCYDCGIERELFPLRAVKEMQKGETLISQRVDAAGHQMLSWRLPARPFHIDLDQPIIGRA